MILASVITVLVELVFAGWVSGGDVVRPIAERLASVEAVLTCYAADRPVPEATKEKVTSLSTLGTSLLRRLLQRSTYSRQYREQMGAVVGLVTRLVDIAANLSYLDIEFAESDRKRIGNLVESVASIRVDLLRGRVPTQVHVDGVKHAPHAVPLLARDGESRATDSRSVCGF
jgi:hypothetical protein